MKSSEIRAPMDGILSGLKVIDGELVANGNELLTVSSRKNYVRGEVNEEDVGEVKAGMKADLQIVRLSDPAIRCHRLRHFAGGRSGNAALHHHPRSGEAAREFDGWDDGRDEYHHGPAPEHAAHSGPRLTGRSGAGGGARHGGSAHRESGLSNARVCGSDRRGNGRRARGGGRSGPAAARRVR